MALFEIKLEGYVSLPCDRCLDAINIAIHNTYELIGRDTADEAFSKANKEEDFIELPKGETSLDLRAPIYEFIYLSIPMQRLCENTPKKKCNPEVLKKLKEVSVKTSTTNEQTDPRWDVLKNIKLN